jgi:colanic acid biosynthesis glycosyl transferase WcaI
MKILIYGLNFHPELTGIGKYTGEMAAWLAEAGHEVRVITAPPYYPEWKIADPYRGRWYLVEHWQGVKIYRTPLWVPKQPTGFRRLLHLASFATFSLPVLLFQWFWKPQIVWTVKPTFFGAPGALFLARLSGAPAWLHVQDFELDAAFDLGLIKGRNLKRFVLACGRVLIRQFNYVSTISNRMMQRAREKGVAEQSLVHFPNWADISSIQPLDGPSPFRKKLDIPDDAVVALYSGNMGRKQGVEILGEAARLLQNEQNIFFIFCGAGAGRADLQQQCARLRNVRFLDLQPLEHLSALLGTADIHLLPQRADAADLVMPSKLTGMLASGRPVIATALPGTELAAVLGGLGVVTPPDQPTALADAILELAQQPERREALGRSARSYATQELDRNAILRRFEAVLLQVQPSNS